MITFHMSTEVKEERRVLLNLPPETPLGEADFVVTIEPRQASAEPRGSVRRHFGAVHSGDARSADNERIDADLVRAYESCPDEAN